TIKKYGEQVDSNVVEKVQRAVENVREALSKNGAVELQSLVAGLDVTIMDLGRAIHTGTKRQGPSTGSRKRRTLEDSGPIELPEGDQSKLSDDSENDPEDLANLVEDET
ncbi:MAG: hypothetical protein K8F91_13795, partial [Candidatus Obscuribacterales bacterium]|nr:hypothetical protein [Candidatus Obscuribacterales bacterium]